MVIRHFSGPVTPRARARVDELPPPKVAPWLISFGDMMTLFLCFFVMLVTLAKTQDAGLMARGLGPFVVDLETRGMGGALAGQRRAELEDAYRARFGLKPLTAVDRALLADQDRDASAIERVVVDGLRAGSALEFPLVATFESGAADVGPDARRYLALLADTLRPGRGQVLVLEGHAEESEGGARLAARRAGSVKHWLEREQGFVSVRVEARAAWREAPFPRSNPRGVDARLVQPDEIVKG